VAAGIKGSTKEKRMAEPWFTKSILATVAIVPSFIAIPFFRKNFGVDPLVFVVWYFGGTSLAIALFLGIGRGPSAVFPPFPALLGILAVGMLCGAFANGSLFQAVSLAPNPGLPPVVYATSSVLVFVLSALLASTLPALFNPVSTELSRVAGLLLVLAGLYLLAGGRLETFAPG
jgi:hypothetical protein